VKRSLATSSNFQIPRRNFSNLHPNFDEACLSGRLEFSPREIQKLRIANKVSQPVFASYLNTSESTVEKWETGAKRPSGMALKLLTIVQKHGLEVLA
jgi:putative transcriptional regulator